MSRHAKPGPALTMADHYFGTRREILGRTGTSGASGRGPVRPRGDRLISHPLVAVETAVMLAVMLDVGTPVMLDVAVETGVAVAVEAPVRLARFEHTTECVG